MSDPILEEVWRVREELFRKYGGVEGLWKHLEAMDRARLRKERHRRRKKKVAVGAARHVRRAPGKG